MMSGVLGELFFKLSIGDFAKLGIKFFDSKAVL